MQSKVIRRKTAKQLLLSALFVITSATPSFAGKGFMSNSFAMLKNNSSISDDIKGALGILEAVAYWFPPLWLVGTLLGVGVSQHAGSEGGMKIVTTVSIILLVIMAILFFYDTKMVPS
jgi:hypothetical protein